MAHVLEEQCVIGRMESEQEGEGMQRKTLRPLIVGDYYTDGWMLVEVVYVTSKGDVDFRDCRSEEVTRITIQNFRTIFRRVNASRGEVA